jgi:hypothetical protein
MEQRIMKEQSTADIKLSFAWKIWNMDGGAGKAQNPQIRSLSIKYAIIPATS